MKKEEITINNIDGLQAAASRILALAAPHKLFALHGDMGAGKTTLVKELCRQLGSQDNFSSPSYSIVNEYYIAGAAHKIYHIDLFRLKDQEEAIAIGIEDMISGDNYCFIEWPGIIADMLPSDTVNLYITIENDSRQIAILVP